MGNNYFRFRQFTLRQELCGMKVGTDGTLLGAWARGGQRVLDIGTGTGLVALMMAQRHPGAEVVGIDIDAQAVIQAADNAASSPFADRVSILKADAAVFADGQGRLFDAIVSNPPYFVDSLVSPDGKRTLARHAVSLTYGGLVAAACRLLADDGELSVVVPFDGKARVEAEAALAGLQLSRVCIVRTTPRKEPRRCLLAFRRHAVAEPERQDGVIEEAPKVRSAWYEQLTKDFYL